MRHISSRLVLVALVFCAQVCLQSCSKKMEVYRFSNTWQELAMNQLNEGAHTKLCFWYDRARNCFVPELLSREGKARMGIDGPVLSEALKTTTPNRVWLYMGGKWHLYSVSGASPRSYALFPPHVMPTYVYSFEGEDLRTARGVWVKTGSVALLDMLRRLSAVFRDNPVNRWVFISPQLAYFLLNPFASLISGTYYYNPNEKLWIKDIKTGDGKLLGVGGAKVEPWIAKAYWKRIKLNVFAKGSFDEMFLAFGDEAPSDGTIEANGIKLAEVSYFDSLPTNHSDSLPAMFEWSPQGRAWNAIPTADVLELLTCPVVEIYDGPSMTQKRTPNLNIYPQELANQAAALVTLRGRQMVISKSSNRKMD